LIPDKELFMLRLKEIRGVDFDLVSNVRVHMRERGKIVPGSHREGHNVFTLTGKNWLTRLVAWHTISAPPADDFPYTHRRVRWVAVGSGGQLEVSTVSALVTPVPYATGQYLAPLDSVSFPTSTSVRFQKEFAANEITISGVPVNVSEFGLFADTNPASTTTANDDSPFGLGEDTILDPTVLNNPPIAYKAIEALPKTVDFTLVTEWEFRF